MEETRMVALPQIVAVLLLLSAGGAAGPSAAEVLSCSLFDLSLPVASSTSTTASSPASLPPSARPAPFLYSASSTPTNFVPRPISAFPISTPNSPSSPPPSPPIMKTTPRHLASSFATSSSGSLKSRSTSSECPACLMFASFRFLLARSAIPSLWTSLSSPVVLSPWLNSSRPRLRSPSVDSILRPPPVSLRQVLFLLAAILIFAPFLIRRILDGDTLIHDQGLWMSLALFVYFGVSGTMHNIIVACPWFCRTLTLRLPRIWDAAGG